MGRAPEGLGRSVFQKGCAPNQKGPTPDGAGCAPPRLRCAPNGAGRRLRPAGRDPRSPGRRRRDKNIRQHEAGREGGGGKSSPGGGRAGEWRKTLRPYCTIAPLRRCAVAPLRRCAVAKIFPRTFMPRGENKNKTNEMSSARQNNFAPGRLGGLKARPVMPIRNDSRLKRRTPRPSRKGAGGRRHGSPAERPAPGKNECRKSPVARLLLAVNRPP
jgi:hypothetical protein